MTHFGQATPSPVEQVRQLMAERLGLSDSAALVDRGIEVFQARFEGEERLILVDEHHVLDVDDLRAWLALERDQGLPRAFVAGRTFADAIKAADARRS